MDATSSKRIDRSSSDDVGIGAELPAVDIGERRFEFGASRL